MAIAVKNSMATAIILPSVGSIAHSPSTPGSRFCCRAAEPRLNCGIAQTMLAIIVPISQPQPSTGLTCSLIASNGRRPVESVTYEMAESMMTPRIMAIGCHHNIPNPASTPR